MRIHHGAKTGQHPFFPMLQIVNRGIFHSGISFFRHKAAPIALLLNELAHRRGGGLLFIGYGIVIAAASANGENFHGTALGQDGLAVFHRQDIIGRFQNGSIQTQIL